MCPAEQSAEPRARGAAGPSPCELLHIEVRFGKTLAGSDRALCTLIRHRDVLQCALGATALHYVVRFGAVLEARQELQLDSSLLSELIFPFPGASHCPCCSSAALERVHGLGRWAIWSVTCSCLVPDGPSTACTLFCLVGHMGTRSAVLPEYSCCIHPHIHHTQRLENVHVSSLRVSSEIAEVAGLLNKA